MTTHQLQLPRQYWSVIDGTLDNEEDTATVDGRRKAAEQAQAIRQAGWEQVPQIPDDLPARDHWSWLHSAEPVSVTLTETQWRFVTTALRKWHKVSLRRGNEPEDLPELEIVSLINRQLKAT